MHVVRLSTFFDKFCAHSSRKAPPISLRNYLTIVFFRYLGMRRGTGNTNERALGFPFSPRLFDPLSTFRTI